MSGFFFNLNVFELFFLILKKLKLAKKSKSKFFFLFENKNNFLKFLYNLKKN